MSWRAASRRRAVGSTSSPVRSAVHSWGRRAGTWRASNRSWRPGAGLDRSLAGDLGVNLDENRMQAELGGTLAPALHSNGYALEAVHGVLGHLFDRGLHHVRAACDARNSASVRLLERAGFAFEGRSAESLWQRGEWTDLFLFGLLARNWKPQNFTS
ncbi:GNAT family N-acetyltransferase [Streptomyces sp. NPDC058289]|uniref:GNAT family N-acetyltransferase n=1 Tax=Streptomyces sp. NPDC058289 TaxID=3346425 RepID=UPI0036E3C166